MDEKCILCIFILKDYLALGSVDTVVKLYF